MMAAVSSQENAFWHVILEMEYAALYAAQWSHECEHGQLGWVLPADTLHWLHERLGILPLDP